MIALVSAHSLRTTASPEDGRSEEDVGSVSGQDNDVDSDAQTRSGQAAVAANASPAQSQTSPQRKTGELSPADQILIAKLRSRDTAVRMHEAAHQGAGGGLVGGASFTYQTGPDGKQYAIGGEVPVDFSPVSDDPEATISKEQRVIAAAMAPADPSSQDIAVANQAAQILAAVQMQEDSLSAQETSVQASAVASQSAASPFQIYARNTLVGSGFSAQA
jgi:hypothetical protein